MGYSPLPLPDMTGQVGSRNVTLALETCLCGCILPLFVTVPLHAHCRGAHFDTLLDPRATPPCTTGTSDSVTPHLCPRPKWQTLICGAPPNDATLCAMA